MTRITKQSFMAGLIAAVISAPCAMAQGPQEDFQIPVNQFPIDTTKTIVLSLDIADQLTLRQTALNAKFTSLIEEKMSARMRKIENLPTANDSGWLVLAER